MSSMFGSQIHRLRSGSHVGGCTGVWPELADAVSGASGTEGSTHRNSGSVGVYSFTSYEGGGFGSFFVGLLNSTQARTSSQESRDSGLAAALVSLNSSAVISRL